jgi:hypothetical protein
MMKTVVILLLAAAASIATQIIYMDRGEVLPMAGSVLIVEVLSMDTGEGDGWCSADYSLIVLDILRGNAETGTVINGSYRLNLPRSYESAMGTVTWVSPLETGSGYEFFVCAGDTVIVLLDADTASSHTVLRVEPLDMRETLMEEMNLASGELSTHRFTYIGDRWRSWEPQDVPPGTTVTWEWTNAEDWQSLLSMRSDTLQITFEVVNFHDIEYRCLIPDMPERWKRVYTCRILEITPQ